MIGSADHPVLSFGLPPDAPAWIALFFALLVPFLKLNLLGFRSKLGLLAATAATLSWGYFLFYLGAAPRIIDATTYLLEARSFAGGSFSFEVPEPTASFRGRFLIHTAESPERLAGIFPPGYPALLSLGVLVGAPFIIGPLLAAALVCATAALAFAVTRRKKDALVAATLSTLCACLRYHTAETMSHGLSALLTTVALWSAVESIRRPQPKKDVILGLCLGFLLATRQLNGALLTFGLFGSLALCRRVSFLSLLRILTTLLPGIALLLLHHHAITGEFFTSPQSRYYDFADGPPGCFGLGLGKGCAYEHGDVVAKMGGGLTWKWMILNTLHRFHFHLMDIAHFEPLVLVGLLSAWWGRKRRTVWPLLAALVLIPLGYSLFYFAGSYPGGGARLFSELLPIWHVLIAWGLGRLRAARWGIFACLLGFSVHASFSHRALAGAQFGPESAALPHLPRLMERWNERTSNKPPVLFFSTAHEFNLTHLASPSFTAARRTHDSREVLLLHHFRGSLGLVHKNTDGFADFRHLAPRTGGALLLETEFDYPPLAKSDLWVHPEHLPHTCVSRGRALALHRTGSAPRISLEAQPPRGEYSVTLHGVTEDGRCVKRDLGVLRGQPLVTVEGAALRNLSHIDRLVLTPTHL